MVDICDLDLIGTKLEQDDLVINLAPEYYKQQVMELVHATELLKKCDIANLVGDRIVNQAIGMKMANKVSIKSVSGVPFLMIYKFRQ